MFKKLVWFIIPFFVLFLDQVTKFWAVSSLELYKPVSIIGDYLRFTLVYNTKGAFSVYLGTQWIHTGLMAIGSLFVTVYFIYVITKKQPLAYIISIGMIVGGAYGNLMDRVRMTKVVDFIEMGIPNHEVAHGGYYWPVYNIADSFVVVGVAILFIYTIKNDKKKRQNLENIESNDEV